MVLNSVPSKITQGKGSKVPNHKTQADLTIYTRKQLDNDKWLPNIKAWDNRFWVKMCILDKSATALSVTLYLSMVFYGKTHKPLKIGTKEKEHIFFENDLRTT